MTIAVIATLIIKDGCNEGFEQGFMAMTSQVCELDQTISFMNYTAAAAIKKFVDARLTAQMFDGRFYAFLCIKGDSGYLSV